MQGGEGRCVCGGGRGSCSGGKQQVFVDIEASHSEIPDHHVCYPRPGQP